MSTLRIRVLALVGIALPLTVTLPAGAQEPMIQGIEVDDTVVTTVRTGTVVRVVGNTLVARIDGEGVTVFRNIPGAFTFSVDGKDLTVYQLRPGMRLTSTNTITADTVATIQEVEAMNVVDYPDPPRVGRSPVDEPALEPEPDSAPVQPPAEPKPAALPTTAGPLPVLGLLGLSLIAVGWGVRIARRTIGQGGAPTGRSG